MITSNVPWHPRVGDRVKIKRTGLIETVQRINGRGDGDDDRYVIAGTPTGRAVYWIEEIEAVG